jgi:hypothetical protein
VQYNWRVYAASLAISMGLLTYGYDSAFIGTTITQKSFMRDFGLATMSKTQQNAVSSNLTSICKTANPLRRPVAGADMAIHRLCGRILWRLLHVLCHGTARAEDDGDYIRCDIYLGSVSIGIRPVREIKTHYSAVFFALFPRISLA